MEKTLKRYSIIGFIFTGITGVLLHFLYGLTGKSIIVAPFSAVNESTWEHMKLLFFPLLIFAIAEYRLLGKSYGSFWCIKLSGTSAGLLTIPFLFYTYKGALGASADWFNIAIFFIAAAVALLLEMRLLKQNISCPLPPAVAVGALLLTAVLFVTFTFAPPRIPLFTDPLTGKAGII
ncbi:MAG: hypothetical protein E7543_05070 [Ruminococcaceae bacterium]|nr:hypothetical protein [Oscillospiraceae bacterium]